MQLRTEVVDISGWAVVSVYGELDVATAPELREQLIELVNEGRAHLVLDLSGVDFLDSTGLGMIVSALEASPHPRWRPAAGLHRESHHPAVRDHGP